MKLTALVTVISASIFSLAGCKASQDPSSPATILTTRGVDSGIRAVCLGEDGLALPSCLVSYSAAVQLTLDAPGSSPPSTLPPFSTIRMARDAAGIGGADGPEGRLVVRDGKLFSAVEVRSGNMAGAAAPIFAWFPVGGFDAQGGLVPAQKGSLFVQSVIYGKREREMAAQAGRTVEDRHTLWLVTNLDQPAAYVTLR